MEVYLRFEYFSLCCMEGLKCLNWQHPLMNRNTYLYSLNNILLMLPMLAAEANPPKKNVQDRRLLANKKWYYIQFKRITLQIQQWNKSSELRPFCDRNIGRPSLIYKPLRELMTFPESLKMQTPQAFTKPSFDNILNQYLRHML